MFASVTTGVAMAPGPSLSSTTQWSQCDCYPFCLGGTFSKCSSANDVSSDQSEGTVCNKPLGLTTLAPGIKSHIVGGLVVTLIL